MLTWYFAYGSNMQSATFRGRRGIEWRRAVAAKAPNWRLVLDKPPLVPVPESFANIVPEPGATTLGVLYEITGDDLAHIDLTEGVLIGNYARIEIEVAPLAALPGAPGVAFTLASDRHDPTLQPSTRYMDLLIEGALEHGLPVEYVDWLRRVPARPPSEEAEELRPLMEDALRRR